jgi:ADP-ribosyl-[dinitrogen reductase] hydrolase
MTNKNLIIGAIAGDIIGSVFEWDNIKTIKFDLFCRSSTFTDDSVLTLATMSALINNTGYSQAYYSFGNKFYNKGYGPNFRTWLISDNPKPYNSWGNGSAMRVSPIGWYFNNIDDTLLEAKKSAEVTHNHLEGIKGAQAVSAAVFLARTGKSKDDIKNYITDKFGYDLNRTTDDIKPNYEFDVSCQGSVPEAIIAFLESTDYESAVRLAVSLGGDSDTIACITGGIAEAFYRDIPDEIIDNVLNILPEEEIKIIEEFSSRCKKIKGE